MDAACPTYCICDELRRRGWARKNHRVARALLDDRREYDDRSATQRKAYFQCLLSLPEVLGICGPGGASVRPADYF
eukprot:5605002-Pyramimonas_sp.AAC.1